MARLVTCISAVSLPRGMSAKPSRVPARLLSFFLLRSAVRNCRNPLLLQHTMLAGMLQIWHRTHEFEKQVPALGSSAQPKQPGLSSLSSLAARCIQAGARRACTCRPWLDRGSRPLCQRRSPQYTGCRPQSCRRRSPGRTTAARGRNRSAARGQLLVRTWQDTTSRQQHGLDLPEVTMPHTCWRASVVHTAWPPRSTVLAWQARPLSLPVAKPLFESRPHPQSLTSSVANLCTCTV